jgi:hypothetical protein
MGAVLLADDRWPAARAGGMCTYNAFPERTANAVVAAIEQGCDLATTGGIVLAQVPSPRLVTT